MVIHTTEGAKTHPAPSQIMSFIRIRNEEEDIKIPIPEDGTLTLKDIESAFPGAVGLRFRDDESESLSHVLCRDGVFLEPHGGWTKTQRIFYTLRNQSGAASLFGRFEQHRRTIQRNRCEGGRPQARTTDGCRDQTAKMTKLHIGRLVFKNGSFKKVTANSLGGGLVVVGPFPTTTNCTEAIRDEAFKKFLSIHQSLRKEYTDPKQVTLVYPDGSKVANLPDNSAEFTVKGYRDYLDPNKKYDRLRLYLVNTCTDATSDVEIISDESSDSLEDPFEETKTVAEILYEENPRPGPSSEPSNTSQIIDVDLTNDTLPLEVKVRFTSNGNPLVSWKFEMNKTVQSLITFLRSSGLIREGDFQLVMNDEVLNPENHLFTYSGNANETMEIEVRPVAERTERVFAALVRGRRRLSLNRSRRLENSASEQIAEPELDSHYQVSIQMEEERTSHLEHYTDETNSQNQELTTDDIKTILNQHSKEVLQEVPNMDNEHFNVIYVSRYAIFEDFLEYGKSEDFNFYKVMKVHFLSNLGEHSDIEIAIDEGGPRREFFRLIINEIIHTSGLLEGPDNKKIVSAKVSALRKNMYFFAGYVIAASLLMGGPPLSCLAPSVVSFILGETTSPAVDEITDFEVREAMKELEMVENVSTMRKLVDEKLGARFTLGVDKPTCMLQLDDKPQFIKDLTAAFVLYRSASCIDQLANGLEVLGIVTLLKKNPSLRILLQHNERFEVTLENIMNILKINYSQEGSNKRRLEEKICRRFVSYIEDVKKTPRIIDDHFIGLGEVLSFITGADKLSPSSEVSILLNFNHSAEMHSLPSSNTCGGVINIPVYEGMMDKDIFNKKMDMAIMWAGGMHAL